jgi:hypothetical protein
MPMIGTLLSVLVDFEMAVAAPDLLTNDKKSHSEQHVVACTTSKEVHNLTQNVLTQCPVAYSVDCIIIIKVIL